MHTYINTYMFFVMIIAFLLSTAAPAAAEAMGCTKVVSCLSLFHDNRVQGRNTNQRTLTLAYTDIQIPVQAVKIVGIDPKHHHHPRVPAIRSPLSLFTVSASIFYGVLRMRHSPEPYPLVLHMQQPIL